MNWLKRFTARCVDGVTAPGATTRVGTIAAGLTACLLSGCAGWLGGQTGGSGASPTAPAPAPSARGAQAEGRAATSSAQGGSKTTAGAAGPVKLGAPKAVRNWSEVREQAARRLVAANPHMTYASRTPDVLLAIPVMSIELNADGSLRRVEVMRYPRQARETVQMAIQAIQNAAPFGDVSRLPKPWRFNETFLFNDERKFKPMTLDRR